MGFGISVATFHTKFGPIMFSTELDKKLPRLKGLGYDCVDLFIRSADEPGIDSVLEAIAKSHLRVSIVAAVSSYVDYGLYLSSPDESVRSRMIIGMTKQIQLAAKLGAKVPIGVLRGEGNEENCLSYLAYSLEKLYRASEPVGVPLLIEPINRYETRMINTVREAINYIHEYDLPEFDLLVDMFHMNIEEPDIIASIIEVKERIRHVHLADSNRRVPGKGHLDWVGIMDAFREIPYHGDFAFEAIPGDDPWKDAEEGIRFLESLACGGERDHGEIA